MLDILFAHPQVEAFTTWDFNDGEWLGAPSGFLRRDGSRKPAYEAIRQRILHDWHTSLDAMTDENGVLTVEGFRGQYALVCDGKEAGFVLGRDGGSREIMLG